MTTGWLAGRAEELGIDLVGVCRPDPSARAAGAFLSWLAGGMHGSMAYMARPDRVARALQPDGTPKGARSMVVVAMAYDAPRRAPPSGGGPRGRIAAYALAPDYHDVLRPRLEALGSAIEARAGAAVPRRAYVDTGPLLERDAAVRAGLGFVGRNTMLIHPRRGSWLLLGELLVDMELEPSLPDARGTCGSCTRCLDACPTAAFSAPHVLDARRCISYLTIEHRGSIDRALRPEMGDWVFGCDVCNEVCPYNVRFGTTDAPSPRAMDATPELVGLLAMDEEAFRARFAGSPVLRARRGGLLRNACVALGNHADPDSVPALVGALQDAEALVRGHAAWALGRIATATARSALSAARGREGDDEVLEEIELALDGS